MAWDQFWQSMYEHGVTLFDDVTNEVKAFYEWYMGQDDYAKAALEAAAPYGADALREACLSLGYQLSDALATPMAASGVGVFVAATYESWWALDA
jgi:hypothetical protein